MRFVSLPIYIFFYQLRFILSVVAHQVRIVTRVLQWVAPANGAVLLAKPALLHVRTQLVPVRLRPYHLYHVRCTAIAVPVLVIVVPFGK